jgi:hypothetical protein
MFVQINAENIIYNKLQSFRGIILDKKLHFTTLHFTVTCHFAYT